VAGGEDGWAADGSAVFELAGVSACCRGGSLACGWSVFGLSDIEAVAGSSGDAVDEVVLG
jgi:hypothetical protein